MAIQPENSKSNMKRSNMSQNTLILKILPQILGIFLCYFMLFLQILIDCEMRFFYYSLLGVGSFLSLRFVTFCGFSRKPVSTRNWFILFGTICSTEAASITQIRLYSKSALSLSNMLCLVENIPIFFGKITNFKVTFLHVIHMCCCGKFSSLVLLLIFCELVTFLNIFEY